MARALRIDTEDAWHHVMNRGVDRRRIFFSARDGASFLRLLARAHADTGVRVLAYCLMPNHYHLVLHCPEAGLAQSMKIIDGQYTQLTNRRLGRDGPLMRGRYHSRNIDTPEYLVAAVRYVHRNPRDIEPPVQLSNYRWSSHAIYLGDAPEPSWFDSGSVMNMLASRASYRDFVEGVDELGIVANVRMTAVELIDDVGSPQHAERVMAAALLDLVPSSVAADLVRFLDFDSPTALERARRRARQRYSHDPAIQAAIARVLRAA